MKILINVSGCDSEKRFHWPICNASCLVEIDQELIFSLRQVKLLKLV